MQYQPRRTDEEKKEQRAAAGLRRKPKPAKRNPYCGMRHVVCAMIGVPYKSVAAPRNHQELRSTEWGGIGVTPEAANHQRVYGGRSWEIMGIASGA